MVKFKNYEMFRMASRQSSISLVQPFMKHWSKHGLKMWLTIYEEFPQCIYYMDKKSYGQLTRNIFKIICKDQEHLKKYEPRKKALLKTAKALATFKEQDNLTKLFESYLKASDDFGEYIIGSFAMDEQLQKKLQKKFPKEFDLITMPYKLTEYQKMEQELISKKPEEIVKEFCWLNIYSGFEKIYDVEYFKELKKELSNKKIKSLNEQLRKNKEEFCKFTETIKDDDWKEKCILMHEYANIKNDRIDALKKSVFYLTKFYEKLAKKIKDPDITGRTLINTSHEEIKDIIKGKINCEEIKKRNKEIIFYYDHELVIITDEKKIKKIKAQLKEKKRKSNSIKGSVANKGKAIGKAKIITDVRELSKVIKGDIIIARVTDPRYTTYIRKCKGIVTDEGGILSHTAIISRELGIPCIIGTKNATTTFKDNDLVEIDADKGTVRRIKKQ